MEKRLLNLQGIEQLTGITFKTIKKRLDHFNVKPYKKRGSAILYDAFEALPALYKKPDSDLQLAVERAKLAQVQAEKIRVETDRLLGKLVNKEEWCEDWSAMLVDFKNKLLGLPLKVSPLLADKKTDEIYPILQDHLVGVINELAAESREKAQDIELRFD